MKNDSTSQASAGAPSPGVGSSDLFGSENDEDAFNDWNRDIDDYVPTLWDAYIFGLNRGRSGMEAILALNVEIMRAEDGKWLLVDFRPWNPRTTEHETCQAAIAAALLPNTEVSNSGA